MGVITSFLKLFKPAPNDYVDVEKHLNENYNKIDAWAKDLVVNDLTTGGVDKALSGEMGKKLKEQVDEKINKNGDTWQGVMTYGSTKYNKDGIAFYSGASLRGQVWYGITSGIIVLKRVYDDNVDGGSVTLTNEKVIIGKTLQVTDGIEAVSQRLNTTNKNLVDAINEIYQYSNFVVNGTVIENKQLEIKVKNVSISSNQRLVFDTAFKNECVCVMITDNNSAGGFDQGVASFDRFGFDVTVSGAPDAFTYIAIGY